MAKKQKEETAVAVVEQSAMAVYGETTTNAGKEGFGQEDMTFPRLAFAQKTSPQVDPENDQYIESLKLYQMFNTLTREVYGNEVPFVIIRRSKRAIEFDDDNNVVDFDVPLDDPRLQFTELPDGKPARPQATLFYEYLVAIPREGRSPDIAMLSLKGTQIRTAKQLNSLISVRPGDIFAGMWIGSTRGKTKGAFTYTNFSVQPAGAPDKELYDICKKLYDATEGKTLGTDRDAGDDVDDSKAPF